MRTSSPNSNALVESLEHLVAEAESLERQGDLDGSAARYQAALKRWPDNPGLLYNLANIQMRREDFSDAADNLRRVTELTPTFAWAHHNLGNALLRTHRELQAAESFRTALALDPHLVRSRIALARLLVSAARPNDAVVLLEEAEHMHSSDANVQIELGNVYRAVSRSADARLAYERAIAIAPESFPGHHNLAITLHAEGRTDEALPHARLAVELSPASALAQEGLGNILAYQGELNAARDVYATAAKLKPSGVWSRIGVDVRANLLLPPVPRSHDAISEARERFAHGITAMRYSTGSLVDPITEVGVVNQFFLAYHGCNNRQLLSDLAAMYRDLCPALTFSSAHCEDYSPRIGRPIRIGIISRYLREHTIGRFLIGLARHLARPEFQLCLFTWEHLPDPVSMAFREAADEYHLLSGSLLQLQRQLASAKLDLLLYGDIGMEPATYFLSFARFAPIQCAFFGHPDTTGVDTIDYYLSWRPAESEYAQEWYSEKLALLSPAVTYAHLPRLTWAEGRAGRAAIGLPTAGHLYLCVQSIYKLHPDFDELLAGILQSDGMAQIALVEGSVKNWTALMRERLSARLGAEMSRVIFLPERPYRDYLTLLASADVVLDTPHFSGGATTLDAIVVATPVVTMAGPTLRSAQTRALFERMGVTDGVCKDTQEYIRKSVCIASDQDLRNDISTRIREASPILFEDNNMVREVEDFFRSWIAETAT